MSRRDRRREFKGFDKLVDVLPYNNLEPGFERDLMTAICRAATPSRNIGMKDTDIVGAVRNAMIMDALDVYMRWIADGVEVKTEVRLPSGAVFYPPATQIKLLEPA
jgi:hypothetical protein